MRDFWNNKYKNKELHYGKNPNQFIANALKTLKAGKILLPAEGEGRNAIYAAKLGWQVSAFDQSEVAQQKALNWAKKEKLVIDYLVASIEEFSAEENYFDCIALSFLHMPAKHRTNFHRQIIRYLKPTGVLLLVAFSKGQIHNSSGGPKDIGMLYSKTELLDDFSDLAQIDIQEENTFIDEGAGHQGSAKLITVSGRLR